MGYSPWGSKELDILCHPLLLLPPIPPSIRVFSSELTLCMRWPKYWSFSFSISPSKEHPALISCRMDWLDLLAVQGGGSQAPRRAVCGTRGSLRTMHGGGSAPSCCAFILAWRIPGTGEPGGLPSMGSHRVGHPGLEAQFPARRREERGCGPVTGKDRASCQSGGAPALRPGAVA